MEKRACSEPNVYIRFFAGHVDEELKKYGIKASTYCHPPLSHRFDAQQSVLFPALQEPRAVTTELERALERYLCKEPETLFTLLWA